MIVKKSVMYVLNFRYDAIIRTSTIVDPMTKHITFIVGYFRPDVKNVTNLAKGRFGCRHDIKLVLE